MSKSEQWTIAQYHADREFLSHSALETFIRSPKLYKRWFEGAWERKETAAMVKGSAVHVGVLEPKKWPKDKTQPTEVIVCPAGTRTAKLYLKAVEEHPGIVLLKNEEYAVRSMISSVRNHEQARKILDGAVCETSWSCMIGGIPCKCRLDILGNRRIIADLKTAEDPSEDEFIGQAAKLGYHRQEAFYRSAFPEVDTYLWIVVGSTEPFDCYVYRFDDESIKIGAEQNLRYIAELRSCRDLDRWASRYEHNDESDSLTWINIQLPAWYKRKEMG